MTFEEIAEQQGWNTDSVATILMDFIDNYCDKRELLEFAQRVADLENNEA